MPLEAMAGREVHHDCENPPCCTGTHLHLLTHAEHGALSRLAAEMRALRPEPTEVTCTVAPECPATSSRPCQLALDLGGAA